MNTAPPSFTQARLAELTARLKRTGLRPTQQRLSLANLLFGEHDRHVSAEELHQEALTTGVSVSLATVYNTLNRFHEVGLVREVVVDSARSYFDTNLEPHAHVYHEETGELCDAPLCLRPELLTALAPEGTEAVSVEVIVRVKQRITPLNPPHSEGPVEEGSVEEGSVE